MFIHQNIEVNSTLGDRVTVKCGLQIWSGIQIPDHVGSAPNATYLIALFPP
jgi:hypothetical protein